LEPLFTTLGVQNARLRCLRGGPILFPYGNLPFRSRRRAEMAWKAPKIVEVPVGMEINMYACAARK
jgi:coenzyme PQQ precursor peptide PqqA